MGAVGRSAGANDYAYIGSINAEMGAAGSAIVTLSGSQSVDNVVLGYGLGTSGTLNLAGYPLTVGSTIFLGQSGVGIGVIEHNGGYFNTQYLDIFNGNSLVMAASDSVMANVSLFGGSQLTTGASESLYNASAVSIFTGSTLTLSTSLSLTGNLDIEQTSTLNMAGQGLNAPTVDFGYNDAQPVSVINRGPITTPYLNVGATAFNIIPSDAVQNLTLSYSASTLFPSSGTVSSLSLNNSSSATTSAANNVISSVTVSGSSRLTLGTSMSINGTLDLEQSSTLNMGGFPLSATTVNIGVNNLQPVSVVNRGTISTAYLEVAAQPFNLVPGDVIQYLSLSSSAQMTTAATANIVSNVTLQGSSTLTFGAPMSINGTLDLEASSTLNMAGFPLSAATVDIAVNNLQPVSVVNRGTISAGYLQVAVQPFNLIPSDVVKNLSLASSAQVTTATIGNVESNVSLSTSSTLTLGASMSINGTLDVETSSTLNMANHGLSAVTVNLGWNYGQPVTVLNRGPITASYLQLAVSRFDLSGSDNVTNFNLEDGAATLLSSSVSVSSLSLASASQGTTSAVGNITSSVSVVTSSTLTLGSSMSLASTLDLEQDATLNMMRHPLHAAAVEIGFDYGQVVNVTNRGAITTANLQVSGQPFNLIPADVVTNLTLQSGASLTTASSGNITSAATLQNSSTLTLGAPMTLSSVLDVESSSMLNMGGQPLNLPTAEFGVSNGRPVNVANAGTLTANYLLDAGGGSGVVLSAPSSVVNTEISVSNNSVMTLQQPSGQLTGLTFHGSTSAALALNDTSALELSGGSNSGPSWIFRWQDLTAGSWVSTLTGAIAAGRIAVSSTSGYSVFDLEGYTYVATPSTLIWNGGGADNNWSTAGNWGGVTPAAGQYLRFGALAAGGHTANSNNLAANSLFYGIFFDTAAPSYNLQGNAIDLSGDVLNQSGTNQTIGLNIQLVPGDGAFNTNAITFDSGGFKITDSGSISGAGMELIKAGSGTLVLSGTNTYSGGTDVTGGKVIVTSSYGLLSGSDLIVGANAATVFGTVESAGLAAESPSSTPVPEPATLALFSAALGLVLVRKCRFPGGQRTHATDVDSNRVQ